MAKQSNLFADYWQMRMKSAEQRLAAALGLITHKPTRGTLAEEVVREIIDAFLPGQWASHTGFLIDAKQQPSKQIDIIVYHRLNNLSPLYQDANVVILPTGTKPSMVEVKSVLSKKDLFEALANVASVRTMEPKPSETAAIVYAFRGFKKPSTLQDHLKNHVAGLRKKMIFDPLHLPDMICLQEQNWVIKQESAGTAFKMTCYQSKDPVIQSLLTHVLNRLGVAGLYSVLPKPKYDPKPLFTIV